MIDDERFLPIGTVILTKDGKLPIMITSFCVIPKRDSNGSGSDALLNEIYDYGGCPYPQGMIDMQTSCLFNHDQIGEILHYGYYSDDHEAFSEILNSGFDKIKEQYLTGELKKEDIVFDVDKNPEEVDKKDE